MHLSRILIARIIVGACCLASASLANAQSTRDGAAFADEDMAMARSVIASREPTCGQLLPETHPFCADAEVQELRSWLVQATSELLAALDGVEGPTGYFPQSFFGYKSGVLRCGERVACIKQVVGNITGEMSDLDRVERLRFGHCEQLGTLALKLICKTPELQDLLVASNEFARNQFGEASFGPGGARLLEPGESVFFDQQEWVENYLTPCGADVACFRRVIDDRTATIKALVAGKEARVVRAMNRAAIGARSGRRLEDDPLGLGPVTAMGIAQDRSPPVAMPRQPDRQVDRYLVSYAETEADLAAAARLEGIVYRSLWFWSVFENPNVMRTVFRGNRGPGNIRRTLPYFYDGAELPQGSTEQWLFLQVWLEALQESCQGEVMQWPERVIETFEVETIQGRDYVTKPTERRYRMPAAFLGGFAESFKINQSQTASEAFGLLKDLADSIRAGQTENPLMKFVLKERSYKRDVRKILQLAGCNSPTTRQFMAGMLHVAKGTSRIDGFQLSEAIPGADWVSDMPSEPSRANVAEEACWPFSTGFNTCACIVNEARLSAALPILLPADADWDEIMASARTSESFDICYGRH